MLALVHQLALSEIMQLREAKPWSKRIRGREEVQERRGWWKRSDEVEPNLSARLTFYQMPLPPAGSQPIRSATLRTGEIHDLHCILQA